jgi:hypothetical protein
MITAEGAQKLVEDFIRDVMVWPAARPIRDASQPSKPTETVYMLGFIPDIAGKINPQSGLSVIWWEPNVQGGCWCSDAGEDVHPTIWWPLPKVEMKK